MSGRNDQLPLSLSEPPAFPQGWCWTSIGEIGNVRLGRQRSPRNRSDKYPTKYLRAAQKDVLSWQAADGSFPLKGWIATDSQETAGFSTAFALIGLQVTDGRLSIHNRTAPKLPKGEGK